ncbi:MAG: O-antigen ligase family protein [Verrucomicrobiota bacterium]
MKNSLSKWIFSSLVVFLSVVLFGGVDVGTQVIVLFVLALGVKMRPLRGDVFPSYLWMGVGLFFLFLLSKEFLPAKWFISPYWKTSLEQDYGVKLGGIHHPEWIRLIQFLLLGIGVGVLLLWWRSFSQTRLLRIHLAWTGFGVALIVAILSFALRDPAIFRLRETVGYDGFGPFPNRNHSAALFAIGLFLGWGCGWETLRHRLMLQFTTVILGMGVLMAALIASNSRGAVAAALISFVLILMVIYLRRHDFRFLVVGAALVGIGVSVVSATQTSLIQRLQGEHSPQATIEGRVEIWKDAWKVIQDAPILGHGVAMYEKVHPFYQTFEKPNHQVLHPESAYLQLIAELGFFLFLMAIGIFGLMTVPAWDEMRSHDQFPLRICALGGLLTLAFHSFVDVPFLRWGNAVMGVLCWVILTATRLPSHDDPPSWRRWSFLIPLLCAGGLFMVARDAGIYWGEPNFTKLSTAKLEQKVQTDPLNGALRHELGMRWVANPGTREKAYREFQRSHELLPSVWTFPIEAAQAVQPYSEGIAFSFWGLAIERSGHRRVEIFRLAVALTKSLAGGPLFWRQFVEVHPELIPSYLIQEKSIEGSPLFEIWKESRGGFKVSDLWIDERGDMYRVVAQEKMSNFWNEWIQSHLEKSESEWESWARVYFLLGEPEKAWEWLSKTIPPLEFHQEHFLKDAFLKSEWEQKPQNWVNTRRWIESLHENGRIEERDQVLLQAARFPNAPIWFKQTAAQIFAAKKDYATAVGFIFAP